MKVATDELAIVWKALSDKTIVVALAEGVESVDAK